MNVEVVMPKMGESINEGTLIKWHKKKGDKVVKDEIIFEISTDKVDTEIPSPAEGVLNEIKVFEQETVEVGTIVAIISTEGESALPAEPVKDEPPSTTQVGGEVVDIPMPKMGESVMEGTITKWFKQVGDKVNKDEIIFEISTDKVDTEVPSPAEGTLIEILLNENETGEVGTIVGRISKTGGLNIPAKAAPAQKTPDEKVIQKSVGEKPSADTFVKKSTPEPAQAENRFYSPLVMSIASKEGIGYDELILIPGTGIGGRVSKNDILNYLNIRNTAKIPMSSKLQANTESMSAVKRESVDKTSPAGVYSGEVEVIPMDNIRKRIMHHMINSRDTSVHVTAVVEADISKIYNFITANKDRLQQQEGIKLTYMPFITYATIKALKEYPLVNAVIEENKIILKKYINLGIAVAVEPNGLIVPNVKRADDLSIRGLAKSIAQLSSKSRNKGLTPEDIMDGTFTITNYGVFGSLFGTPIINQPEVAILGLGAVTKKPVVVKVDGMDSIAIKPMMYLSLSHDHRLVDGMLGGKFLNSIKNTLENFDVNLF